MTEALPHKHEGLDITAWHSPTCGQQSAFSHLAHDWNSCNVSIKDRARKQNRRMCQQKSKERQESTTARNKYSHEGSFKQKRKQECLHWWMHAGRKEGYPWKGGSWLPLSAGSGFCMPRRFDNMCVWGCKDLVCVCICDEYMWNLVMIEVYFLSL